MYDILIIGGGVVGQTLAIGLHGAGFTVRLIDAIAPQDRLASGFDGRTTAFSLGSTHILERFGIWDEAALDACPIWHIRVSDGPSRAFAHYDSSLLGTDPMGYIVENNPLYGRLASLMPSDIIQAPARVARVEAHAAHATVHLEDGEELSARLVIGADGRNSLVRQQAGIDTRGWSYGQHALVCMVELERPHQGIAHERFLPSGPLAVLPMNHQRASIVWSDAPEVASLMQSAPVDQFNAALTDRFGPWLGNLRLSDANGGQRWIYPLSLLHAKRYVAPRMALAGDAAHSMHPIAGQGLNLGLRDVAALVDQLLETRNWGGDIGALDGLEAYERQRRPDVVQLLSSTDSLTWLFSNELMGVRHVRRLGLNVVEACPPLKRRFMRRAMGL